MCAAFDGLACGLPAHWSAARIRLGATLGRRLLDDIPKEPIDCMALERGKWYCGTHMPYICIAEILQFALQELSRSEHLKP